MMTPEQFKEWLEGHKMTRPEFAKMIGMPSTAQLSTWLKKPNVPQWVVAYTALYDEHQAMKAKYEPEIPVEPTEPLLLPDTSEETQRDEAAAERRLEELTLDHEIAPLSEEERLRVLEGAAGDSLILLPDLAGSMTSRGEALPMRRKIIEEMTSPTWWVKVFKERFLK